MSPWLIYFVLKMDSISCAFQILSTFVGVGLILLIILYWVGVSNDDDDLMKLKPSARKLTWLFALFFIPAVLLPDTKTVAAMYIVPKVVESKAVQQDIPELYNLAIDALKESLRPESLKESSSK